MVGGVHLTMQVLGPQNGSIIGTLCGYLPVVGGGYPCRSCNGVLTPSHLEVYC